MIKFSASKQWYRQIASVEAEVEEMSAGASFLIKKDIQEEKLSLKETRLGEGFSTLLRMLRLEAGLSFEKLSKKINANIQELILLEKQVGYKASPRTLVALSELYKIPSKSFLKIGGALKNTDQKLDDEVIRFAAESESFDRLTKEEKILLQKIIKTLAEV